MPAGHERQSPSSEGKSAKPFLQETSVNGNLERREAIDETSNVFELDENGRYIIVHNPLPPRELLRNHKERRSRFETIDVNSIILDGEIPSDIRVEELVESIRTGKQESEITVRPRLDDHDNLVYDKIDGLHRILAFRQLGIEKIRALVEYNCSDEEMYDLRIVAAKNVADVQFARIATDVTNSFRQSTWYKRKGLTITQVLGLLIADNSGRNMELTPKEAKEAKEWAREKCRAWKINPTVLYQKMLIVENADPDIVKRVRLKGGGGKDGKGVFNLSRFNETIRCLPKKYKLQYIMYALIKEHDLCKNEITVVAEALSAIENNPEQIAVLKTDPRNVNILRVILKKDIITKNNRIAYPDTFKNNKPINNAVHRKTDNQPSVNNGEIFSREAVDTYERRSKELESQVTELTAQLEKTRMEAGAQVNELTAQLRSRMEAEGHWQRRSMELEKQIVVLTGQLESGRETEVKEEIPSDQPETGMEADKKWWQEVVELSSVERYIVMYVTEQKQKGIKMQEIDRCLIDEFNKKGLELTQHQLDARKQSAIVKYANYLTGVVQKTYSELL